MSELERTNKIRNTLYAIHRSRHAFTLAEILIAVAILGILAAIALPTFRGHIAEAKESAAKDNLRILRNTIELYAVQHNTVPPGYLNGGLMPAWLFPLQFIMCTNVQGDAINSTIPQGDYTLGPYLKSIPKNPFNDKDSFTLLNDDDNFPSVPAGNTGWIYKPATKTIKLDWPGTDNDNVDYFDY